jgi:hypothetical protein
MGRLEHLKQSLPKFAAQFPTVMVDWSCPEKSGDWASTIDNVIVVNVPGKKHFSQSGSRNAGGHIVYDIDPKAWVLFLDADVLLPDGFREKLESAMTSDDVMGITYGGGSTFGQILCKAKDFIAVNGYNEALSDTYGGEDTIFRMKIRLLGRKVIYMPKYDMLSHSDEMRFKFIKAGYNTSLAHNECNRFYGMLSDEQKHLVGDVIYPKRVAQKPKSSYLRDKIRAKYPESSKAFLECIPPRELPKSAITVWQYWEGPKPPWIELCMESVARHEPNLKVIGPKEWQSLRSVDCDVNIDSLVPAHRADYIRAYLLANYGGVWLDADYFALKPISPAIEWCLTKSEMLGLLQDGDMVTNGILGAQKGSAAAWDYFGRLNYRLRQGGVREWDELSNTILTKIAKQYDFSFIKHELVQPYSWREVRSYRTWSTSLPMGTYGVMLYNQAFKNAGIKIDELDFQDLRRLPGLLGLLFFDAIKDNALTLGA